MPRLVESGRSDPMHRVQLVTFLFFVIAACGNPHDGPRAQWPGPEPHAQPSASSGSNTDQSERQPIPSKRQRLSDGTIATAVTMEDFAEALGVHTDFYMLASIVCSRHFNCGWVGKVYECAAEVTKAWCQQPEACAQELFQRPTEHDPCQLDAFHRECGDTERPIQCEALAQRGLVLGMSDGLPPSGPPSEPIIPASAREPIVPASTRMAHDVQHQ